MRSDRASPSGRLLAALGAAIGGAIAGSPRKVLVENFDHFFPLILLGIMGLAFLWALLAMPWQWPPGALTAPNPGPSPLFDRELDGGT